MSQGWTVVRSWVLGGLEAMKFSGCGKCINVVRHVQIQREENGWGYLKLRGNLCFRRTNSLCGYSAVG